ASQFMTAVKRTRLDRNRRHQAMPLVGHAGSPLRVGLVGILHRGGLAGDEGVLAVVHGAGIRVGEAQISSVRHAPVDGERGSVVEARSRALKFVNRSQLRDGTSERINAGWPGTVERAAEL